MRRTVPEIARSVVVLPGAVRAEDRDDLALVDRQRHAAKRLNLAVARIDVPEGEQRRMSPVT